MTEKEYNDMFKLFSNAGENVLIMNHYELHDYMKMTEQFDKPIALWKEFLLDPKVQKYIKSEFSIIQESNMRKIIATVDEDDRSAGKAQLINAMLSANEKNSNKKEGTTIIYAYILPNEKQAKATNTEVIKRDPFDEPHNNQGE